ncbi:amidohydrolase family protein, partial [Candidatus Bipolaricaulota bacterium]|nr:amidohydrolase family protein [Candidatus Bipolaricaulota bacterium]
PHAEVIDACDLLLMPGLINAHMHSYGLLAHGIPVDDPPHGFYEFLADFWWPHVEDRLDHPMIKAALAHACGKMIKAGFTSVCDVLEAPNALPGALAVEAEALNDAGLRGVLSIEASERLGTDLGRDALDENARFVREHDNDRLIRGMVSIHTSFTCSEGFIMLAKGLADDLGCSIHLHLSESSYEPKVSLERYGMRPVEWYDRLGFWDSSVLASQGVAIDRSEIDILAERGVRLVHMPLSNCEVGGGIAPVPAMIARGIRPGLGTDGYINDPFEVMRGAFLIHKGALQDPQVMPAETVLSMATSWGAEAVDFLHVGTLAPGESADLIGIDLSFDTPLTEGNVLDQIILYRNGSDVALSIVDGALLMKDHELLTLDMEEVRHETTVQARRLWGMD